MVENRRQVDVHDRAVEDDHDVAETKHVKREPAAAAVHGHASTVPIRPLDTPQPRYRNIQNFYNLEPRDYASRSGYAIRVTTPTRRVSPQLVAQRSSRIHSGGIA